MYGDYQLTVTNKGGHSSEPRADNAIYQLAQALMNVAKYQFPLELNNVSRAYFERLADDATGQRQADIRGILKNPPDPQAVQRLSALPSDNSVMRTNCVATRLDGGHANNALPQRAQANINCRILPGHSLEEVRQQLIKVINDPQVTVHYVADDGTVADKTGAQEPAAAAAEARSVGLDAVVAEMWPHIKVIPFMSLDASGRHLHLGRRRPLMGSPDSPWTSTTCVRTGVTSASGCPRSTRATSSSTVTSRR
jgi:acetylornithine deacetylase/succinyl-diaminopimelate desuccinylase-like protein